LLPGNFEVFQQYSRGSPSAKVPTAGNKDPYGFDMIGGGSLHSSQFGTATAASGAEQPADDGLDNVSNLDSSLDSSSHY
jgi:hypothetical protein